MSTIQLIQLHHFRNLTSANLSCSPHLNILYGDNGSGKTSLLEALSILVNSRSFRTTHAQDCIQHQQPSSTIYIEAEHQGIRLKAGCERRRSGQHRYRLGDNDIRSSAPIAAQIPLQMIDAESHHNLVTQPKTRRSLIDWIAFHTQPEFLDTWRRYQATLHQCNACLKLGEPSPELDIWTHALAQHGEAIHANRLAVLDALQPLARTAWSEFFSEFTLTLREQKGWPQGASLLKAIHDQRRRDLIIGHVSRGPHRGDCDLLVNGKFAHAWLSQGQQKMLLYALRLAAGALVEQITERRCIYLLDECFTSLDDQRAQSLCQHLLERDHQCFVTSCSEASVQTLTDLKGSKLFHVEHGHIEAGASSDNAARMAETVER